MGRERRGEKPAVRGPMGTANGERGRRRARRGAGAGRYFSGGRASVALSGRAERSCEAPTHSRRAARRARGGARAAEETRRADSGGERSARGCGSRRSRRRLLQEEPRGHRPCPRPASGHRCSPGAPRGLACVKVNDGWGCPGAADRTSRARPQARRLCGLLAPRGARSRAGFGVTPPASLLGAAPPCALATSGARLEAPGCAGAALVPQGVSLRCVEASGVWGRGGGVERARA